MVFYHSLNIFSATIPTSSMLYFLHIRLCSQTWKIQR